MDRMTRRVMQAAALVGLATPLVSQQVATTPNRELAKLQGELSANPNSVKALRAVGIKLYELQRYAEARPVLDKSVQLDPNCGPCALYAGLAAEKVNDPAGAKAAYTKYLASGKSRDTKNQVRDRLLALAKQELKDAAKTAVANEAALRGVQVPDNTVAVLPFRCACADTSLLPLERGMAELVVTDLSRSPKLRVLERARMQAIVDEINLSRTGQVDATTAARTGKLIAAGRILNGQIIATGGQTLNVTGALVNTNTSQVDGNPSQNGTLNAIFDIEKQFVGATFRALGVTLTPAEQREFDKRPTSNLAAFLAFSRGLMAEDAGRLDDAVRYFDNARTLDPGFTAALQRAQAAAQTQNGAQVSTAKVEQSVRNSTEGGVVAAASRGSTGDATIGSTLANVVGDVNPTVTNTVQNNTGGGSNNTTTGGNVPVTQNQVSQTTGGDQPATKTGAITITIRRP